MSAVTSIESGSQDLKLDFLNLLVAQLQNQNPLEPMDSFEMTSQLAQISQLEQLDAIRTCLDEFKGLGSAFGETLALAQARYAATLIGRQVTFALDGEAALGSGRVTGVQWRDGEPLLEVGERLVGLDAVQGIQE